MDEPEIEVRIRAAGPEDKEQVRNVLAAAFDGDAEADLTEALIESGDAEYALVAEAAGHLIGIAVFSRLAVSKGDRDIRALALAPVGVHPELQGLGIGTGLVAGGLALAERDKWDTVVVLGDPDYYSRLGFTVTAAAAIDCPYSGPNLSAWVLPGTTLPEKVVVRYPDPFHSLN